VLLRDEPDRNLYRFRVLLNGDRLPEDSLAQEHAQRVMIENPMPYVPDDLFTRVDELMDGEVIFHRASPSPRA